MSAAASVSTAKAKGAARSRRPGAAAGAGAAGAVKPAAVSAFYAAGPALSLGGLAQAKLTVGQVDDAYEREADAVAADVTSGGMARRMAVTPLSPGALMQGSPPDERKHEPTALQRQTDEREEQAQGLSVQQKEKRETELEQQGVVQSEELDEGQTQLYRDSTAADEQLMASAAAGAIQAKGAGQPLVSSVRQAIEPVLGADLSGVRVHDDSAAHSAAAALKARAFTHRSHIWLGPGEQAHDRALLAHEAAHVVQQHAAPSTAPAVQRNVPPPPPPTQEAIGLPSSAASRRDEQTMIRYLGAQSHRMLALDERLSAAHPQTAEQREALEETLIRAVRLNAIGLMASHRAAVETARDRLEGRNRFQIEGDQPPQATSSVLVEMREAAQLLSNLQAIEERLENYRSELRGARSRAIFHRGSVGDALEIIAANGAEFMDEDLRAGLREGWQSAQQMGSYWLWAYGAANALMELREQQIAGIRLATSEVYSRFPLFSQLRPSDVLSGDLSSDRALLEASRRAYRRVLEKIDDAIRNIATGDIHPFDMPKAVEATRAGKPPEVQQALNEAQRRHEVRRFWLTLGLTALEIILCFIPVVGPALALGVGAVALGMTLEDMLDRLTVARASTDPHESPVGVQAPSAFEWTMVGVAGILMAFGGAAIARSAMRSFRAFGAVSRLAPELSAGSRMRLARLMTRQPELLAAPRTTGALEAELRATGVELSAGEIQALRAASYERAGLPLPRSSSQSLDSFLDDIWNERQTILQQGQRRAAAGREAAGTVYSRYSRAAQQNPLTMSNQEYLDRLSRIRSGRPQGAVSDMQGRDAVNTFHRFERAGADLTRVRERIYLNVNADQAPDVMEFVVRNIVDDPTVPGVQMAKLSGPGAVSSRADAIVIYLDDAAAVENVLGRLRNYQQAGSRGFRSGGPALTEEVMEGVSVAQEPTAMHGGASFGQVRSRAVFQALDETIAAGGAREQFIGRVRELLQASGVNPDAPHLNLPVPAGPGAPPGGALGGPPVTPALLLGQGGRSEREQSESE